MNFPQNLKYTNEHEWIRVEGDIAYVGITDYAQEKRWKPEKLSERLKW